MSGVRILGFEIVEPKGDRNAYNALACLTRLCLMLLKMAVYSSDCIALFSIK